MFSATVLGVQLYDAPRSFLISCVIGVAVELRRQHRGLVAVYEGEAA
jgi:hypothetical protein